MSTQQGSYNTYIGARYVPIFGGQWDNTKAYEPLVIVEYQGNSYTSKTYVPIGADINNTDYWALTGNYNAQVEAYRQQVQQLQNSVDTWGTQIETNTTNISDVQKASYLQLTKSFVFFGDSITWGQVQTGQANPTFPQKFGEIVKANAIENLGIGGTTLSDWEGIPAEYRTNAFVNRMKSYDFSPYDTVFIMYGTNDYGYTVPLGQEFDTDTTTFYGALNTSIEYMCQTYPTKEIFFLIPPYANTYHVKNSKGLTMFDYMSALLSRCRFYNIPTFDFGALLGVNDFNISQNYWDSALHPNQALYEKMGTVLAKAYYFQNTTVGKDVISYIMPDISGVNLISFADFNPTGLHPFTNQALDFGICFDMNPANEQNYYDSKRQYYMQADEWYTVTMSVKADAPNQRIQWSMYQLPTPTFVSFVPKVGEHKYIFTVKAQSTGFSIFQIAWEKSNTSHVYVSDLSLCVGKVPLSHTSATISTNAVYPVNITNDHVETDNGENTKWCVSYDPQSQRCYFTGNMRMLTGISNNILGTIPTVFRPANTQYVPVLLEDGSNLTNAWIAIAVNGEISYVGTVTMAGEKQIVHLCGRGWNCGYREFATGTAPQPV